MKRFLGMVLVVVCLFGLSFAQVRMTEGRSPMAGVSEDQRDAIKRLPDVQFLSVDEKGVPNFVTGRLGYLHSIDKRGAKEYFDEISPVLRATGREELAYVRTTADRLGMVHMRFQQYLNGLPVVGAEVILHADRESGEVTVLNGRFLPDEVGLPVAAEVNPDVAMESAAVQAGIPQGDLLSDPVLTYVVNDNGKAYLAWAGWVSYVAEDGPHMDRLFADAVTGDLVAQHGYYKRALYRKIYNGNHTNPDYPTLPGTLMFQEGGSSTDSAAMDCYTNFGYTYNFYKNQFNRDSFDNSGAQLIGTVHVGTNWVNAYWNGTQMVFGDGDGSTATYLSKALDVVAHELTHAVTEHTANLTYSNESGALNEGMSDIFGASVEAYRDGGANSNTWKIGEECWTPGTSGDALRYMNNPTQDGQSYDYYPERYTGSSDYGGVHLNNGIANLAFYLLCQGGTHPRGKTTTVVTGIGITKADQIFYRALTTYMTSSTNFQGARNATAQAAADLYGGTSSTEYTQVQNCWTAVGVPGGPVTVTTLTNNVPVSGLAASTGTMLAYKIAVPSGQTSLVVTTTGGTGDADLYVKRGAMPTTSSYDGRGYTNGNAETVTINNPVAGDFYIGVQAYSTFSGVTLKAVYTGSTQTPDFTLNLSSSSLSITQGSNGSVTATTAVSGGFNSAVSLSASGLPSGASASFNPTSIAAPGSGSSTLTINSGTAAAGTYSVTVTGTGSGLTRTAALSLTINSSGGGVVVITNGQTVSGIGASTGTWKYYKIAVPASQTSLVVKTTGGTGDADLYVKFGSSPTTSSYDGKSESSTATETVTINNPSTGDYYIGIYAYSTYSSVSLQATYTGGGGGGSMNETESNNTTSTANTIPSSGTTVTAKISSRTDVDYFKVVLSSSGTLTVDVVVPSSKDYDVGLYNSSGTLLASGTQGSGKPEHVTYTGSAGTYYIKVYGYNSAYSSSLTYTCKATW
jgi:Zn-dependent metalloprotease